MFCRRTESKDVKKNEEVPIHLKGEKALQLYKEWYLTQKRGEQLEALSDHARNDFLNRISDAELSSWLKTDLHELIKTAQQILVDVYFNKIAAVTIKATPFSHTDSNVYCWGKLFKPISLENLTRFRKLKEEAEEVSLEKVVAHP